MAWVDAVGVVVGGGDDEDGQGDHREPGEAVPCGPGPALVMVESDLCFRCLEDPRSSIAGRRPRPGSRGGRAVGSSSGRTPARRCRRCGARGGCGHRRRRWCGRGRTPRRRTVRLSTRFRRCAVPCLLGESGRDVVGPHPDGLGGLDVLVAGDRQDVADPAGPQPRPQRRIQAVDLVAGDERHEDRTAAAQSSLGSRDRKRQHRPLAINGA